MSTTTTDPTPVTFTYNIAFTAPVNTPTSSPHLSASELWTGIKRGGRNPHDFAEYVSDCTVLSGDAHNFRRRLVLADGAVHTASGAMLDQDVHIANKLHVWKPIYFSEFRSLDLVTLAFTNASSQKYPPPKHARYGFSLRTFETSLITMSRSKQRRLARVPKVLFFYHTMRRMRRQMPICI
jgi:hypothetical protein